MDSGVAFVPAVPGLAPRGLYAEGRGCPCYLAGLWRIQAPSASWGTATWPTSWTRSRLERCCLPGAWRAGWHQLRGMPGGMAQPPAVPGLAPRGLYAARGGVARVSRAGLASEREAGCRSELAWSERRAGCPERTSGEMARATPTHARGCPCYRAGLASEREAGCRSELAWSERRAGCPERTSGAMARATPTYVSGPPCGRGFAPRRATRRLGR